MSEVDREALLSYFDGDEMAADVWKSKYAAEGEIIPDDMHRRMAKEFARIEVNYANDYSGDYDELSEYGQEVADRVEHSSYDDIEEHIYNLFKDFKYIIPQGSIMSMLGTNKFGSLSNCFVIGQPYDSYGGIFHKDQEMAQLEKRRGGVGLDISTLRPKGVITNNAAKTSTGAASFMERFSNTTREVAQDGRRGALMLTIDVRHPDVFEFVNIKKDRTKVTGANVSVMERDDFMEAVKKDEDYILRFPCEADINNAYWAVSEDEPKYKNRFEGFKYNELYSIYDGNTGNEVYIKRIKAKELFDAIVENAWENAEPGQMFVDRHWSYSPDGVYPQYRGMTTNPCGEIFMQPYDACRLLALNLYSFVDNPFTENAKINLTKLYEIAYEQQRLADNIVDLELEHIDKIINKIKNDPEPEEVKKVELDLWVKIRDVASSGRRTGCGFTGLADMIAALGFKYDSEESKEVIDLVLATKMNAELDCTIDLAILRGTFDGWEVEDEFDWKINLIRDNHAVRSVKGKNQFYQMLVDNFYDQVARMSRYGRRNVSWSTVAPTGTVSMMTRTSSGLEPIFLPFYFRRKKINPNDKNVRIDFTDQNGDNWQEYPVLHPKFKEWIEVQSEGKYKIEELDKGDLEGFFKESPWYNSTANDIDWEERINIQAIIQKYTSHSISSTINLPNNISKEEVSNIYMKAYDKGLKGVTIYREGSRTGVLISSQKEDKDVTEFKQYNAPKRPKVLPCEIHKTVVKGTEYLVVVGLYDNKPYEVFAQENKWNIKGNHLSGDTIKVKNGVYNVQIKDNILIEDFTSDMLPVEEDITRGYSFGLRHGGDISFAVQQLRKSKSSLVDFSKAIARVLAKYVEQKEEGNCPECKKGKLIMEEGCTKCMSCGYSKC